MRIKNTSRLERIKDILSADGYCSVEQLAERCAASVATIRRDLLDLEQSAIITRTHGGAYSRTPPLVSYTTRDMLNQPEKMAIAAKALEFVRENDTIYLDPGTTIEQFALQLRDWLRDRSVTIITPSVLAFRHLAESPSARIILLGGLYNPITQSLGGSITQRAIADLLIDKYFMATNGVVPSHGLTDSSEVDCEVKKMVLDRAREVILLVDSSKFQTRGLFLTASLNRVHKVVTDQAISRKSQNMLRESKLELLIAP